MIKTYTLILILAAQFTAISAQTRTVGLKTYNRDHEEGYYLFTPLNSKKTFLIDACGNMINSWTSAYTAGASQLLTEDGELYRCGLYPPPHFGLGAGGIIERYDWQGNVNWKFVLADSLFTLHHDIELMPNGNILAIVWEYKSPQEALDRGRKSAIAYPSVWSDRIIEIRPLENDSFEIVWEWSAWDHMIQNTDPNKPDYGDPSQHPERLDINFTGNNFQDWLHINSVNYNPTLDQIVLSIHSTSEIIIIDHSTSTVTAAGHSGGTYGKGGDILYRWGNPAAYGRGSAGDQKLFKQHNAHWIPAGYPDAGKIMVFNNGWDKPGTKYSTIDVIDPPVSSPGVYMLQSAQAYGPVSAKIAYQSNPVTNFYAPNLSSVTSLKEGYFINSGPQGRFFETDKNGNVVWEYVNPINGQGSIKQGSIPTGNMVFRCYPIPADFKGLDDRDLSPKGPLETDPYSPDLCQQASVPETAAAPGPAFAIFPNPAGDHIFCSILQPQQVQVCDISGKELISATGSSDIDISELPSGTYLLRASSAEGIFSEWFVKTE